jgi:bifunctional non-homologous end joining protein LigD
MSLRVYNRKRKFGQTPEPRGKIAKGGRGQLRFVVQMHDATRLHFDLRLEFGGVFKSWAVPKGPSLNPVDQRLAVFVEDHPLEYGSFEGIIPKGNYGAGTVMVWDEGTYVERGSSTRAESEAAMTKNFAKGHLTFVLDGRKLKGEFALIKLKKGEEKAWLLVKKRDEFSTYKRTEQPSNESVKTGRTMEEIEAEAESKGDVWLPKKGKTSRPRLKTPAARPKADAMPRKVRPMLATLGLRPPGKDWILEPNPEGLRAIAEVEGKRVSLYSKAGLSFDKKYPRIVAELKDLGATAVLDGEIVNSEYFVFDLLYWQDRDLRDLPLRERKKILISVFKDTKHVKHVSSLKGNGIAKNPVSPYRGGTTSDWLIVKESPPRKSAASIDEPRLTNLDKIYFPGDGITKGDVIDFYRGVAPYILPYLKDRPESLNRMPNGIAKPGFFQKDMTGHIPRWLKTERIFSNSADKSIDYMLCQDEHSLLYMANLGCIEINPWLSRVPRLDRPDYLVIDLDPDENSFDHVIAIAHEIHEILDEVGAANFCKTSGATGIHIGIPLGGKYTFDEARPFAENVCRIVARRNPALTSVERNPARRRGKIYLDFLQNRRGQT